MSYRLTTQVIGAEELAAAFRRAPQLSAREFSRAIGRTAYRVEATAKREAPIEHGVLRGSINTKGPTATGNNVEASVGTNVEYAKYQEQGTGIYGPRKQMILPVRGKLMVWSWGGQSFFAKQVRGVKPRWYFRTARDEAKPYFTEQMRGALTNIVRALATT